MFCPVHHAINILLKNSATITSDDADKQGETDNLYERREIRDDDRNAV